MSDDTQDHTTDLTDPSEYEDPVSQRAMAFCHVAKLADTIKDEAVVFSTTSHREPSTLTREDV